LDGIREQVKREPLALPKLVIAKKPIFDLKFEDFELQNYQHLDEIKFPISV
jgi:thymidylate synthase